MRKELGKITSVTFGHGGYQNACIGLNVTLGGESWGVGAGMTAWDSELIKHSGYCKWTEESRNAEYADIMRYVCKLLKEAKVGSVDKLLGVPVEAEFDGMMLKSWRILSEVL